jgi:aryl-alcohol dehydrogenase-like predicted oxidoreductase
MRYRQIPRTDMRVSEIGFGCWTMGGPNWSTADGAPIGWADVDEGEILAGIKAGLDSGVNHWDNADIYGNGRAERMLADAFRRLGVDRASQIIATKVGHARGTAAHAYEPFHIRRQCEQSLRNLRSDVIDIYYFHHGSFVGPGRNEAGDTEKAHDYLHEAAETMRALVKEGKVRAVGQSAYSAADFERAVPVVRPNVLQSKANLRYDEFIRAGSAVQRLMREHGCGFVAFGPLDQGILLNKFDPEHPPRFAEGDYRNNRQDFNAETLRSVRGKLERVRERFSRAGVAEVEMFSSVASRWVLSHANVCSTIPGFRNERQARCNLRAMADGAMTQEDAAWLRELFGES